MELLYRATRDGMTGQCFHNKCDNKGETICLYKNEKGNIFGGYASIPWTNDGSYHSAPDSFLFTLTNIHNIEPTKFFSKKDKKEFIIIMDLYLEVGPIYLSIIILVKVNAKYIFLILIKILQEKEKLFLLGILI